MTGEPLDVLRGHRELLAQHGWRYLDPSLFLSHNTDGPGNPLSKVYTAARMRRAFADFAEIRTRVRFLNFSGPTPWESAGAARASPPGTSMGVAPVDHRDEVAIACSTAASKASAIARWLKRSTSRRA